MRSGLMDLVIAAIFLGGPWGVVATRNRTRWRRFVIGGAIGPLLLVLVALSHLQASSWTGNGVCF
jgi:hypothetical protein